MKAAIPIFGTRVSPRFFYSDRMVVFDIEDEMVAGKEIVVISGFDAAAWVQQLLDLNVDVFICGGADRDFIRRAEARGISVKNNVAGEIEEVIEALLKRKLREGYGLTYSLGEAEEAAGQGGSAVEAAGAGPEQWIDCMKCRNRVCRKGEPCAAFLPEFTSPPLDDYDRRSIEFSLDIAHESERKMCRIAEVVYFAHVMGFQQLGLAFCIDMFEETEMLYKILRRFFKVRCVCCRICSDASEIKSEMSGWDDSDCNPKGQALALNEAGSELNITAGLCVGCSTVFSKYSNAPVTTLFVKDKLLANNPVGALYSKYYLDNITEGVLKK